MFSAKRSRVGVSQQLCVLLRMETDRKILPLFFFLSFFSHQRGSWNVDQTASCALFLTLTFAQNAGIDWQNSCVRPMPWEILRSDPVTRSFPVLRTCADSARPICSGHWLAARFQRVLWSMASGNGDGNAKNGKKPLQTRGWKHICRISCDVANT